MKCKLSDFLIKFSIIPILYAALDAATATIISVTILTVYRDLIGLFLRLKPMPVMDVCTFFGLDGSHSNIMSAIYFERLSADKAKERFSLLISKIPKMRYSIVNILGDLYYKELPQKQVLDIIFNEIPKDQQLKDQKDIDRYISQNINIPFDFSRPQFEIFWQENYQEKFSLLLWKQHHSFCDGASLVSFINSTADKFDISALFPIKEVSSVQKIILKLGIPFYFMKMIVAFLTLSFKENPLHDGKRQLTGRRFVSTGKFFEFNDVKECAKTYKVTINDLVTSCLSTAIKEYFRLQGDTKSNFVNLVIPANIRFKHYQSIEDIKLENKFAVVPLRIPLFDDIKTSLREIPKATSRLRSAFGEVYATYFMTKFATKYFPYFFSQWYVNFSSMAFTMALSNTPGILKPLELSGSKQIYGQSYIQTAGHCGLTFCILSYVDKIRMTVNVDESIMQEPEVLKDLVEKYLDQCIEMTKQ
ncbi:ws dgat mgat [Stylonychia lemnae]|uniref:Ws dgat mgat n=1 Tax=Stylonychia lemnae TaxID=5949 RepID=A0A077ZT85_STYLE|nr:ws dgat mgat [Stylonychia lemnae]|eukprot:CDW71676.1 ws dgat mgat [Stylonychia lemnae]